MAHVLLFQLDGKIPNLALMRLASHHRALGDSVELRRVGNERALQRCLGAAPDVVYGSAIFTRSRPLAERLVEVYPDAIIGGTGWDLTRSLEDVGVATLEPDYSIYPTFRASLGFTQRGCRLKCPFCVVPRKEGRVAGEQTIGEIWRGDGHPREIVLLDNDFFGHPAWPDRIAELREGGFKVSFNQGINARFLTEETAEAIASVDYRAADMKRRVVYTAWDSRKDEARLFRGLEALAAAGVKPRHIMVYMLIGYWPGETHEDRDYRRRRLREFGALPYPMPFERTPELVGFMRWVVGAYDKRIPWETWARGRFNPRNLGDARQLHLPVLGSTP